MLSRMRAAVVETVAWFEGYDGRFGTAIARPIPGSA
jgi:hypothetical protein